MDTSYLLFFFAGLGTFNGLVLAAWLTWRQPLAPASPASRWLAALVLMLSVRTGKSVLFYFWPDISKLVLQVGLTACFLIGPCLIGFVRAHGERANSARVRRDPLLLLALMAFALGFGAMFPYSTHTGLWQGPVWRSIQYFWLACLLLSAALLLQQQRPRRRWLGPTEDGEALGSTSAQTPSSLPAISTAGPLAGPLAVSPTLPPSFGMAVSAGVALVWAAYFWAGWTSYIAGALSFSMLVCLSIALAVFRQPKSLDEAPVNLPYQQRKIAPAEAEPELQALQRLMAEEQLYRDPGLTLNKLARRLAMPPARLSQLLNDNRNISFRQYLNQLRIEAAKELLCAPATLSMEQVAEASGYLSMSTFYSSFKKAEGATPAAWRQARSQESGS